MGLRRSIRLFNAYDAFVEFKEAASGPKPPYRDSASLRDRASQLAQRFEPGKDRSELDDALSKLGVSVDFRMFEQVSTMLRFLGNTLFRDVSQPIPARIRKRIHEYDGTVFFFVGHTSYFDYILAAQLLYRLGMEPPVMHVTGSMCTGWLSNWLLGLRSLEVPKHLTPVQHRAYAWFTAALAEYDTQVLFARTSRYTVRARDGILREPYVPHGIVASVKSGGKALVVPLAVSYSAIPEDRYLTASTLLPALSVLPRSWTYFLPFAFGVRKPKNMFRNLEHIFGDVSLNLGEPFELADNESLTQQRISHRAIEEIARNKVIHPSQLVARAMRDLDYPDMKTLRDEVEKEIEHTRSFFYSRYRKEPPFHPLIESDVAEAIQRGIKVLSQRKALGRSTFRRRFYPRDLTLLRFYGYHADRRIYPLSGRNTLTVINAGVWGYTLALHIGRNLLRKEELEEHSLVLYDSREDLIEKLTVDGKHPWHFKDIPLPRSVRPEADLRAAIGDTSLILVVTPSKYFYSLIGKILELAPEGSDLVIATKGFIPETGLLPCQTAEREMERLGKRIKISVLSGANLAHEIVQGGAGVTQIACEEYATFLRLKSMIETRTFRVVYSTDVIGTTIAAALKNVYAIGFGILEGSKKAPENFLATYSTLVTAEIRKFGMLLGASPETFGSESQVWMADLLATCRGGRSASFGRDLAGMDEKHGKSLPARVLLEQYRKKRIAIEGYEASRFAQRMASQRGFHPPILGEIYSILHGGKQVNVDDFVEKCLDALTDRSVQTTPAAIPFRPRRP